MASKMDPLETPGGGAGRRRAVMFDPAGLGGGKASSPKSPGGTKTSPKRDAKNDIEHEWLRSDYTIQAVADMKLNYPTGLHPRTAKELDLDTVHNRMIGLPGDLNLDKTTSDKYFGMNAREKFFGRYQWLNHQRDIISTGPNEELGHLYFDNEKHDTNKLVPFGPIRSKSDGKLGGDDTASRTGSQNSGGSAFRSRFKSMGSATETEKNMLRHSAARSGVRKIDFEDDLAHADDSFLSFGEVVEVPSLPGDPAEQEWDNVSEVTMAQEDVTHRLNAGFYNSKSKKMAAKNGKAPPPVLSLAPPDSLAVLIGAARNEVKQLTHMEDVKRVKVAAPPPVRLEPEAPVPAPHGSPSSEASARKHHHHHHHGHHSHGHHHGHHGHHGHSSESFKMQHNESKTMEKVDIKSPKAAGGPSYNPATSSLRIKFLTPDQSLPPYTNATAFNGCLKPEPATLPVTRGIAVKETRTTPANTTTPGKSGAPRPSTASASISRLYTSGTHSSTPSKVTTPRRLSTDANSVLSPIGSPASTSGKHMNRPKTATTSTTAVAASAKPEGSNKSDNVLDSQSASKASRRLRVAAKVEAKKAQESAQEKTQEPKTDTYSKLILEDLLTRKNVKLEVEEEVSHTDSVNRSSQHGSRTRGDDDSLCSASTVSTIGLGLYLDRLDLESLQRREEEENGGPLSPYKQSRTKFKIHGTQTQVAITSPRTKYLAGCMQLGLNPRASLVLRKNMSKQLNLQHHGMGDQMGVLLAESIQGLPHIQSINIADNMLTDVGMGPIIMAAVGIPGLLELNLSQNEIGPVSAKALFEYLSKYIFVCLCVLCLCVVVHGSQSLCHDLICDCLFISVSSPLLSSRGVTPLTYLPLPLSLLPHHSLPHLPPGAPHPAQRRCR